MSSLKLKKMKQRRTCLQVKGFECSNEQTFLWPCRYEQSVFCMLQWPFFFALCQSNHRKSFLVAVSGASSAAEGLGEQVN
jgi:hypothetical protein